jgi:PAS domain S-box-containing protein
MQLNNQLIALPNLQRIIERYPLTISPNSSVIEAIVLMNQAQAHSLPKNQTSQILGCTNKQKINSDCIFVVEEKHLLGIFTTKDVIRLVASSQDLCNIKIAEVTDYQPVTLQESDLQDSCTILSIFNHNQINYLPIVDDQGKLLGGLSQNLFLQELDLVKKCQELYKNLPDTATYLSDIHSKNQQVESKEYYSHQNIKILLAEQFNQELKIRKELEQTIEELKIIEEEIRLQNEQLLSAREIAELERQRYYDLFEFTPYGCLITDKLGLIQEANQAASTLLSVKQKRLIGQKITSFIVDKTKFNLLSKLKEDKTIQEWELILLRIKHQPFPASVRVTAIYDIQGQHTGWSWLISDISERKQTENDLLLATVELEQRVAERTAELVTTNKVLQQEIKERQETEIALRKSEAIFRQFGENIQAHIWINKKDFSEIVYVNPAYEKIWGRSCQSLRDNPLSLMEAIYPEDRNYVLETLRKCQENYQGSNLEYRIVHTDKSIRWLWVRYFPIKNEQREIQYFGGISEDITERKLAEQSVRESETRLKLALEIGKMGIWEKRIDNLETCIWSETTGPLYGLPKGSNCPLDGKYLDLVYPEDRAICIQAITNALEKGEDFTIEHRVVWPDGSLHWLSSTGKVFYDDPKMESLQILGTTTYISERKDREDQLREQAALLNVATDAIFVRDFQAEIVFWNQGAEKIYGFSQNETVGKNLHHIFDHKTAKTQETIALQNVVKFGSWQGELRKQTTSGKVVIVESRWTLMLDSDKQPKSILIVDTDITEKKQLEEQFLRTQRLESIGSLANGIAHNLNNTLTPISTAAQLLESRYLKDQNQYLSLLNIIENNAKRGSDLVKQVLSFARGLQGEKEIIQVKHLIKEIMDVGQQTICKSIEFQAEIQDDLWMILGDSTQIYQVLMNLVVNANHAMPAGGLLTIKAENIYIDEAYTRMHQNEQLGHYLEAKVGNHIVITVSDTGTGIAKGVLERIFEPFFTTKEADIGTGVGLSTVKVIMKNHNGFLTVTSQVNQGTTFKLFLPSVEAPEVSSFDNLEIPTGNGELILIVDDELEICNVSKIILENHNYRVLIASNGLDAIAIYGRYQQQISCVIMDMVMPEMDGTTAIYSLQKINPEVKVIACSGLGNKGILTKLSDVNVQAILSKPYTANELLINLHQVIIN